MKDRCNEDDVDYHRVVCLGFNPWNAPSGHATKEQHIAAIGQERYDRWINELIPERERIQRGQRSMNSPVSKETQAAQRLADRKAARANRLLGDGLRRLRTGQAPTKAQRPFVAAWIDERDNEVKRFKKLAEQAQIDKEIADERYGHIAIYTNTIFEVIRGFGIVLYGKGEDDHEWECEVGAVKGGKAGYASFADALRAALEWRIRQGLRKESEEK